MISFNYKISTDMTTLISQKKNFYIEFRRRHMNKFLLANYKSKDDNYQNNAFLFYLIFILRLHLRNIYPLGLCPISQICKYFLLEKFFI